MAQRNSASELRRGGKCVTVTGGSIAILLAPVTSRDDSDIGQKASRRGTGRDVFRDFQRENKLNLWNKPLAESMRELTYLGWFEPGTLFVQGTEKGLDGLREAFSRRVLKPPRNFTIHNLEYLTLISPDQV
ncbi:storkhead-box protein 1-like [Anneissia japonica]|uniref:storkhead-box protein 1-like n=1 Tax=Anneissia japonica TaxID=1529436 RepID=UPI0014257E99|nr:storkhead-box protein 1-like [Anneissia japonica]